MKKQNHEIETDKIRSAFFELKKKSPGKFKTRLNLPWSNWGFGIEPLADSAARLEKNGIKFIEPHGNHYGPDLGCKIAGTRKIPGNHGITVGICGIFLTSPNNDAGARKGITLGGALISNRAPWQGQWTELSPTTGHQRKVMVPATSAAVVKLFASEPK